jgi:hypothetical protein
MSLVLLWQLLFSVSINSHPDNIYIRVLPRLQKSLWYFRCLRMGKIDVNTYKYVIIYIIILY